MDVFLQDLRFAFRTLRKTPGFAAAVIATLALGIGANSAIFSLIDGVILRTLPVANPDQLVEVRAITSGGSEDFTLASFERIRDESRSLDGVFAFDGTRLSSAIDGKPEIVWGQCVSGNFFEVLGVNPIRGRELTSGDDRPAAAPAAVISYAYWKRRFALDPAVLGRTIVLKDVPFRIVGVAPEGFLGIEPGFASQIWVPMSQWTRLRLNDHDSVGILARLRPNVRPETARAEIDSIYRAAREAAVSAPGDPKAKARIELLPAGRGLSNLREDFARPLAILMGLVAMVLLVACANVANLALARSSARQREIAVRLALGASRGRLVRQLLTESVVLALIGGSLGLLVASVLSESLVGLIGGGRLVGSVDIGVDGQILGFTAALSVAIGLLFGLTPALRAASPTPNAALRDGSPNMAGDRRGNWVRGTLVVAQVSVCLVLLVAAGLLARSLHKLFQVNPGFARDHIVLATAYPTLLGYEGEREIELYDALQDRLRAMPGVRSASLSRFQVSNGGRWTRRVTVRGARDADGSTDAESEVLCSPVSPGFFETMAIPVLLGRDFDRTDRPSSASVAVVTRAFARSRFPAGGALGRRVVFSDGGEAVIVGVVGDVKAGGLRERQFSPVVYIPLAQTPGSRLGQIVMEIRTDADAASVRRQIQALEGDLPVVKVTTERELLADSVDTERLMAALCGAFAILALALACTGLYGVLSYSVAVRTREMGIRAALGARPGDLLRMVLRDGIRLTALGIAVGLLAVPAAVRIIAGLLFDVSAADPLTLIGAGAGLLLVAAIACYVPARRAMGVDPLVALRSS